MATNKPSYPASLDIDYPNKHDRLTTFARILWSIPAFILLSVLTGPGNSEQFSHEASKQVMANGGGIASGLFAATVLMILFRQRYPRWWFDFGLELNRFRQE